MNTRSVVSLGLLRAAVLLAVAAMALGCSSDEAEQQQSESAGVSVEVEPVEARTVERIVTGIGTLEAVERVQLQPEVAGRVAALHFVEGGRVQADQLLVELDGTKVQQDLAAREAQLRSAEAELADAERTLERQRDLRKQDLASQGELDRATTAQERAAAERDRLQAEVRRARQMLADMRIRAPFAGVISEQHVDPGAFVGVGDVLAELYRTDVLEIRFAVPERYYDDLALEQPVRVRLEGREDQVAEGEVIYISPVIDPSTRTVTVRARLENNGKVLRPGAFATASIILERRQDRVAIPDEALVATRTGYVVFTVDESSQARRQAVETGLRRDGWVEITAGLDSGARLIRSGHMRVDDGSRVNIREDSE